MLLDLHLACDLLAQLKQHATQATENSFAATYSGTMTNTARATLPLIAKIIGDFSLESVMLKIDGFDEAWNEVDFSAPNIAEWSISITDKEKLLKAASAINLDVDGLLFLDVNYFVDTWLPTASGLMGSELYKSFKTERPLKIFVYGLDTSFGGPRTAIIPTKNYNQALQNEWLSSSRLPQSEKILKQVHFVTSTPSTVSPERFLLNWGVQNPAIAHYFNTAFSIYSLISLSQEFYDWNKVIIKGKRKLEIRACNQNLPKPNKELLDSLKNCVEWCYAENDEETRILLVIDRLSLDLKEGEALIDALRLIPAAFAEAKSRYKYVVLDRKKDYTKELSDIQKDLSGVVDKYVTTSHQFVGSLLSDVLALAFILTAGVVSRRFIAEDALRSPEAVILFRSFAIYLVIAVILRMWGAIAMSIISTKLFTDWKEIVRSHMSANQLQEMIDNSLFPVKVNFWASCIVIFSIYAIMALSCWNVELTLSIFGVLDR